MSAREVELSFPRHELLWVLPDLRGMRAEREPQANQVGLLSAVATLARLTRSKIPAQMYISVLTLFW